VRKDEYALWLECVPLNSSDLMSLDFAVLVDFWRNCFNIQMT